MHIADYWRLLDNPQPLPNSLPKSWSPDVALKTIGATLVPYVPIPSHPNAEGYTVRRRIALKPTTEFPQKVLIHEMAHVVLDHDSGVVPRSLGEVEAESVALLVSRILGFPGEAWAKNYIEAWAEGQPEMPDSAVARIFNAVAVILKAGQKSQTEEV